MHKFVGQCDSIAQNMLITNLLKFFWTCSQHFFSLFAHALLIPN